MITRHLCPVAECGWYYDCPDQEMTFADWRGTIQAFVSEVLEREYMDADRIIGAHLATHTPLQWLETLNRERQRGDLLQAKLTAAMEAATGYASAEPHEIDTPPAKTCLEAVMEILQEASRK